MNWARGMGVVLLAWWVGVALQFQQAVLWPSWLYGGILAWGLLPGVWPFLVSLRPLHSWRALRMPLAGAWRMAVRVWMGMAVAFALTGLHAGWRSAALDPALEGQDLDVVGVVQAMPQQQDVGWRFRFDVEQAWLVAAAGHSTPVKLADALPSQVYLGWYGQGGAWDLGGANAALPEPVQAGERWRFRVRLKAPHGHLNPRGFDYELWLWEQGIRATGYVRLGAQDPPPVRMAVTWQHPIEGWRQSVRDRLLRHLNTPEATAAEASSEVKRRLAGVVAALVVGDQAAIDRSDWDLFRATGVAHLMSISGLHVTMFAWLSSLFVAWCWRRSALFGFAGALHWPAVHVGAVLGWCMAAFYALFSGWGVPAQRTLWMLLAVVVLKISARQWHASLIWLLAGAVVLLFDPWALLQPGFWLSFVAVGVLMATERPELHNPAAAFKSPRQIETQSGTERVSERGTELVPQPFWHRTGALARPLLGWAGSLSALRLWREQATITLALAPLTLLFFGQVSLVGLLANVLAIPWVTLVVTPLARLGVVWSGAWTAALWALQPMAWLLGEMAAWPMASVSLPMPPLGLSVLALLGATAWVLPLPLSWKLLCLPLLWPVLLWEQPRPASGQFELLAADVGQGNAVLVRTAQHSLLYDAGPRYSAESDAGHRVLVPLLAQMGERLDVLMLSHRDSDHTGGAAAVLAMQPQAALWSSLEDEHVLHTLRPHWTRCHAGQSWLWDGVLFEVLHPPAKDSDSSPASPAGTKKTKPNAVSCVLRISSNANVNVNVNVNVPSVVALLPGDIEAAQEAALVQSGLGPVHWLLVPHHGSKTSSTEPFLQALQPRLAFVQAGYRNRYGHPAAPVLERYRDQGIPLVESTRCGAATWQSAAPDKVRCERVESLRYWHHALALK